MSNGQHKTVACIGMFDGVHMGHQALVAEAAAQAAGAGLPLTAVTFDPDPMAFMLGPTVVPQLLSLDRRRELLAAAGADVVRVLPFDEKMLLTSPADFIGRYLVTDLAVAEVVVGPDFLFGHRAAGTVETLREGGRRHGFGVHVVEMVGDERDRWSATRIRALIADGDVSAAAVGLTRSHGIEGVVVHGDHRGRELGYPTANLHWQGAWAIPADGVYAGWLMVDGEPQPAAISVGTNPHFDGSERRIESYVLDQADLDLYGLDVRVDFVERLRGQRTFDDLQGLLDCMAEDVDRARAILG